MVKVTYPGPHDAVHVPAVCRKVAKGESIDVPAAARDDLVAQGWNAPKSRKSSGAKKKAPAKKSATEAEPPAEPPADDTSEED